MGFLLSVFVGVPLHAGAGAMRMFQRGRSPGLGLPEPRAVLPVLPESKNVTVIPTKTATTWKLLPRAVVTKLRVFTPLLSLTALAFSLLAMGKNTNLGAAYDLCCICASISKQEMRWWGCHTKFTFPSGLDDPIFSSLLQEFACVPTGIVMSER